MKSIIKIFTAVLLLSALVFSLTLESNNDNVTASIISLDHGDISPWKGKNLKAAFFNIFDGTPSSLKVVLVSQSASKNCGKDKCLEFRKFKDNGKNSKAKLEIRASKPSDWTAIKGQTARVYVGGQVFVARYSKQTHTITLVQGSYKKVMKGYKNFRLKPGSLKPMNTGEETTQVIPGDWYDWLTDQDGACCTDCWATHRSWGLPCAADKACCFGECGVQPGCGGSSPGNPGGGPGNGDDDDDCGSGYFSNDVKVEIDGQTCTFSGYVQPTRDASGMCVDVLSQMVLLGCGPNDDIRTPDEDPAELEQWF
ncbi:MAG: hypothetical protein AAF502_13190 [Bacteroidota bacterium]